MALGSKGDRDRNGSGSSGRGRPYGVMLLLAFGAAVLGVMVLHKLRERRICTLLIKDKDHDLMHLQFLLQKERESTKEMKRKNEELKAKAYSLRTQKMDLSNKVAAIQSITSSLKEEHRVLESTLHKKQNELNSQIKALRELLKQKEDEIEEMKSLVEKPSKIWSVSSDDPSNRTLNLTVPVVTETAGKNEEIPNAAEMEKLEKGDNSTEENQRKEEMSQDQNFESLVVAGEKDNGDKTEVTGVKDEAETKLKNLGRSRMIEGSIVKGEHGRRSTRRTTKRNTIYRGKGDSGNGARDMQGDNSGIPEQERRRDVVQDHKNDDTNGLKVDTQSGVNGERNFKLFERSKDAGFREIEVNDGEVVSKEADHGMGGEKVEERQELVKSDGVLTDEGQVGKQESSTIEQNQIDSTQEQMRNGVNGEERHSYLKETNATSSQSGAADSRM